MLHAILALGMLTATASVAMLLDTEGHPHIAVFSVVVMLFFVAAWKLGSAAAILAAAPRHRHRRGRLPTGARRLNVGSLYEG